MIVPLVDEPAWLDFLSGQPQEKVPPQEKRSSPLSMLVVAPHPDDETLGAGGLIAAQRSLGIDVTIAAVTDGEKSYPDTPGLASVRRVEQEKALQRLGVPPSRLVRFGLPDSNVASHEQKLFELLFPLVHKDVHVVAPWTGDFHPDHEACGRVAQKVASLTGAPLTWYFFWTWHRGTPSSIAHLPLRTFALTDQSLLAKTEALRCHGSQLRHPSGEPILPETLLAPAYRPFEVFASA